MKRTHTIAVGIFAALMSGIALSARAQAGGMDGSGGSGPGMMMGQGHNTRPGQQSGRGPGMMGQAHGPASSQQGATGPMQHGGAGAGPMAGGCPMMSAMAGGQTGHTH
ncbi:MAG: hypothetical protein ACXWCY_08030 [Burkholderiales bacterium]